MAVDQESLKSRFGYLVPLNKLPADRQSRLLAQSDVIELRKKETLFRQGDRDDFTFYVLDGDLEMFADGSLIKRVSGGEGASFQPLAQLQPRQMTAIAKTKVNVLRVRRSLLEQLLSLDSPVSADYGIPSGVEVEEMEAEQSGDWLMTLLQSELFTRIPPSNIQGLLDTLEPVTVQAGDEVIKQGEAGDYYYAVQSGTCEVVRTGSNKREIRLAELGPGDTFGEEALISGARRNATVRMTTAGELARLTQADFTRLVKAPLLTVVDRVEAEQRVTNGARWLDVRFEDEHAHNGLPASLNIPLGVLRTRADELDEAGRYVAYCDTGGRSSAAAFLLAERGFEVCYVEGGAVDEPAPAAGPKLTTSSAPAPPPTQAAPVVSTTVPVVAAAPPPADAVLEAAARASSLGAEVAKADLTIEQAQKMMAQAQAMKAEAEHYVAEKLERERTRLDAEFAELKRKMSEAEALKAALAARERAAQAEALRQQAEAAAREHANRAELERRQVETAAREQAARAELARLQAAALSREQAVRVELERQQAEVAAREQASRAEIERHQAEAAAQAKLREHALAASAQEQQQQEAARADIDRQRLAEERLRIQQEATVLTEKLAEVEQLKASLERQQRSSAAEAASHQRLHEQQQRIEHEAELLTTRLAEAEKLKTTLLAQQALAEDEVAREHQEVDKRLEELERTAALRLREEEQRLAELYQLQADKLESMQAGREAELRDALRKELASERGKFELTVSLATAELERARDERAAAIAAKEATAADAQHMIDDYKRQQQRLLAEQQVLFAREREKLRAEAERIEKLKAEAVRVRKEAEIFKAAAERELASARRQAAEDSAASAREIDLDINEIEQRASAASRELKQAIEAESAIVYAAEEHEDELERTYNTATEINKLLHKELKDWVGEQDDAQESHMQREILSRQKEMVERIRARAVAAKAQQKQQTQGMLDEIQAQLAPRS